MSVYWVDAVRMSSVSSEYNRILALILPCAEEADAICAESDLWRGEIQKHSGIIAQAGLVPPADFVKLEWRGVLYPGFSFPYGDGQFILDDAYLLYEFVHSWSVSRGWRSLIEGDLWPYINSSDLLWQVWLNHGFGTARDSKSAAHGYLEFSMEELIEVADKLFLPRSQLWFELYRSIWAKSSYEPGRSRELCVKICDSLFKGLAASERVVTEVFIDVTRDTSVEARSFAEIAMVCAAMLA